MMVNLQDYIINSKLFKTFKVDDLLFVEYHCLVADDQAEIWTHHNYLAYVLGGQKMWNTPQNEYLVSSSEALFVKRGAHTVYQYFTEQFRVLFIFLPDSFIQQVLSKYPELTKSHPSNSANIETILPLSLNGVLDAYFNSLMAYFLQPMPPTKALLKLKMEELILSILSQPDNQSLKQCLFQLGQSQKVDLEEVMNTNFFQPFSISDFARLSARSLSSFRRDFKAIFNTNPGQWLTQQRLQYSRFLLETTDQTISEVMDASGFKNRSHFIKVFKQAFGTTPKKFCA